MEILRQKITDVSSLKVLVLLPLYMLSAPVSANVHLLKSHFWKFLFEQIKRSRFFYRVLNNQQEVGELLRWIVKMQYHVLLDFLDFHEFVMSWGCEWSVTDCSDFVVKMNWWIGILMQEAFSLSSGSKSNFHCYFSVGWAEVDNWNSWNVILSNWAQNPLLSWSCMNLGSFSERFFELPWVATEWEFLWRGLVALEE